MSGKWCLQLKPKHCLLGLERIEVRWKKKTSYILCTSNAARSVMARIMFEKRVSNYIAIGAGTLVLEGHPMSQRTRKALERFGISDPTHRSTQFGQKHVGVDLIVAMEPSHIEWIRKNFPEVAQRTATPRLVRDLTEEGSHRTNNEIRFSRSKY